jgi:hypothetical protein
MANDIFLIFHFNSPFFSVFIAFGERPSLKVSAWVPLLNKFFTRPQKEGVMNNLEMIDRGNQGRLFLLTGGYNLTII